MIGGLGASPAEGGGGELVAGGGAAGVVAGAFVLKSSRTEAASPGEAGISPRKRKKATQERRKHRVMSLKAVRKVGAGHAERDFALKPAAQ